MRDHWSVFFVACSLTLAAVAAGAVAEAAPGGAGFLTDVWVGEDLSCQAHTLYGGTANEFAPGDGPGSLADCGTLVAWEGTLYGPGFGDHPAGTKTGGLLGAGYVPFTPVSQMVLTGPHGGATFVTEVALGTTGLHVTQVDVFDGASTHYTTQFALTALDPRGLPGANLGTALVYRVADCKLFGDDDGYASDLPFGVGCRDRGNPIDYLLMVPGGGRPATTMEGDAADVWEAVADQDVLPNTAAAYGDEHDNAMALAWEVPVLSQMSVLGAKHTTLWMTTR